MGRRSVRSSHLSRPAGEEPIGQDFACRDGKPWNCGTWTADRYGRQTTGMREPPCCGADRARFARQVVFDCAEPFSAIA